MIPQSNEHNVGHNHCRGAPWIFCSTTVSLKHYDCVTRVSLHTSPLPAFLPPPHTHTLNSSKLLKWYIPYMYLPITTVYKCDHQLGSWHQPDLQWAVLYDHCRHKHSNHLFIAWHVQDTSWMLWFKTLYWKWCLHNCELAPKLMAIVIHCNYCQPVKFLLIMHDFTL